MRNQIKKLWQTLKKEPLMQFVLMGSLVFSLYALTIPVETDIIEVNQEALTFLAEERELVLDRPLSLKERELLRSNYIEEEVLLREAYTRGLDQQDATIRMRLVEKMRFLLTEEPAEPTEQILHQFYLDHQQLYLEPARISFTHVFFSNDQSLSNDMSLIDHLRAGANPSGLGEAFWLGQDLMNYSKPDLIAILGPQFTSRVFHCKPNQWSGPYESIKGTHFVKVTEIRAPRFRDFEEVKHFAKEDWTIYQRRASLEQQVEQLKMNYQIVESSADKSI